MRISVDSRTAEASIVNADCDDIGDPVGCRGIAALAVELGDAIASRMVQATASRLEQANAFSEAA